MLAQPDRRELLQIDQLPGSEPTVLFLRGEIDHSTTRLLMRAVARAAVGDDVVLDMAEVTFFSAAGVTCLVRMRNWFGDRVRRGRSSFAVCRTLDLCGMPDLLRPAADDAGGARTTETVGDEVERWLHRTAR